VIRSDFGREGQAAAGFRRCCTRVDGAAHISAPGISERLMVPTGPLTLQQGLLHEQPPFRDARIFRSKSA
jgi:hypothetical protein